MAESECPEDSIVLIHDGVRPYVSYDVIANNIATVKKYGNAITSTACYETIMISEDGIVLIPRTTKKGYLFCTGSTVLLSEGYHCST